VRIIGGEWRRHWLSVPADGTVRPTADRVRETLFNWLQPRLPGAHCLDLFAGSGALGIEAVSRGAAHATLIERLPAVAAHLARNIGKLQASPRIQVLERDAVHFLTTSPAMTFDIVFVDPPYASDLAARVLPLLAADWLTAGALVYLEGARTGPRIALPEGWRMMRESQTRHARYGLIQIPG